nr:MAG TPA_asm: tail tape measure [Caudoviricetes sp.]
MRFDNQQFERNVQTSIDSIGRLQNSLQMKGATDGLKSVEKTANEISLDKIAVGVEALQNRFSTLGIVGMRAIENITDSVIRLATKTVNFLTNGIIQGGIKRAMNIENAHFQLQGLLKDEEKVQAVMKDAMDSVDGTAYAYDSAAKAASQFAASGMEAGEDMQSALRAITGVAAMTNSEYEDISRIFTTVSGNGRLMGEQLLQLSSRGLNAAATIAEYMTKTGNGAKVTEADVRDMVSKGKVSFELFAKAMDDTFGEHAKKANETFTGAMSNIKAALARIGALFVSPLVVQNGPLVQLFNAIRERVNDVKEAIGQLANQFTGSVNKMAETAKAAITKIGSEDSIKIFSNIASALVNTFSGLWSILAPVGRAFRDVFPASTAENLISFTNKLKEMTAKLKFGCQEAYNLRKTFKGVFSVVKLVADAFIAVVKGIGSLLSKLTGIRGGFLDVTGAMGQWLTETSEAIRETGAFEAIIGGLSEYLGTCVEDIRAFTRTAKEKFISPGFESLLGLIQKLGELVGKIGSKISEFFKGIGEAFDGSSLNGAFTMMGTLILLKVAYRKFFDDWIPVIKRWKSLMVDGFLGTLESVIKAPEGIISAFNALKSSLWTFNKSMKYDNIMKLSKALLILAAAMLVISLIDKDKMAASLTVMTALIAELMGVLKIYDVLGSAKITDSISMTAAATSMIMLATAVTILASALKKMSGLSVGEMITGISGVTALVTVLIGASKIMSTNQKALTKFGGQMLIMATAITILASACEKLSKLSIEELSKGVGGVVALVGSFVAAAKILNDDSASITKFAGQMLVMSTGIAIMAKVCESLSALSWDELIRGGSGLLGVATILVSAAKIMAKGGSAKGAGQMILMATSIAILGKVLTNLSGPDWDQIIRGLAAIGASIVILAVGLKAMNGTLAGSAALLVAAAALLALTPVLSTLGSMSWEAITKSIVALSAAFAVLGVSGAVLAPLVPVIFGLSAAIALMGAGMLMAGVGITAMAAGLTSLAAAGTISATAIASVISAIIVGIVELIPTVAVKVGEGIIIIAKTIANGAKSLAESTMTLIMSVLDTVVEYTPAIIDHLCQFVIKIFEGLTQRTPEMVDAGVKFIVALFSAIVNSLKNLEPEMAENALVGIAVLTAIIVGLKLIGPMIGGAMSAVLKLALLIVEIGAIFAAFGALSRIPGLTDLVDDGGQLLAKVGYAIGNFIGSIIGGLGAGITSGLPVIGQNLADFTKNVEPFVSGVSEINQNLLNGAKALAEAILIITATDFISGILSFISGGGSLVGFTRDLVPFGEGMVKFSNTISGLDAELVEKAAKAGTALAELEKALPKTGGVFSLFAGDEDMKSFSEQLEGLGVGLNKFSKSIIGIDVEKVTSAIGVLQDSLKVFKQYGDAVGSEMISLGSNGLKGFCDSFENSGESIRRAVDVFIANFNSEVVRQQSLITNAFTQTISTAISDIRKKRKDFVKAGEYLAEGLISGINNKKAKVYSAGYSLGQEAVRGEKDGQKSKSPSKLTEQAGEWLGEGLIIGMRKMYRSVYRSGKSLGEASTDAMSSTISKIADIFGSDMDSQPTIRPIVDLSEVRSGANAVNDMFSKSVAFGPTAAAGRISASVNQKIQNGGESDVVSAIRELRHDLAGIGHNSYTINGIEYDDGSNVSEAVRALVRAARIERRA